jgi:hypothetical protein
VQDFGADDQMGGRRRWQCGCCLSGMRRMERAPADPAGEAETRNHQYDQDHAHIGLRSAHGEQGARSHRDSVGNRAATPRAPGFEPQQAGKTERAGGRR